MTTIATFTQANATQALRDRGLAAMGLAAPMLSARWANTTPPASAYDANALTLDLGADLRTPFACFVEYVASLRDFVDADGAPITGGGAILRLHPQAYLRLRTVFASRYQDAANAMPAPAALVVRGAAAPTGPTPARVRAYAADEALTLSGAGTSSFHCALGVPIDPLAVAAIWNDLTQNQPAFAVNGAAGRTGGGGVEPISQLQAGSSVRVQVLEPHGSPYRVTNAAQVEAGAPGSSAGGGTAPSANGLLTLSSGDELRAAGGGSSRVRLGWSQSSTLDDGALTAPALPSGVTLNHRFLRAVAVDLGWHILGNRSDATLNAVPGVEEQMRDGPGPRVREGDIDLIASGSDALGQISDVMTGAASTDTLLVAVSPVIASDLAAPNATGADALWPRFPASTSTADFTTTPPDLRANITASWTTGPDIVVEIADAANLPDGAAVRVYTRDFKMVPALTSAHPSFIRANGGAGLVSSGAPTQIVLSDPFEIGPTASRPTDAQLHMDIVVKARGGGRRVFGDVIVDVADGPASAPATSFGGSDPLTAVSDERRGLGISPLFGAGAPAVTPSGTASGADDLMRIMASESAPRSAPRAPFMGRLETIAARAVTSAGTTTWRAVLTGGRLTNETRSALHNDGDPGNPPGPDLDAPAVRADGPLAYDLARLAIKRARPILPISGGEGWLQVLSADAFNAPSNTTGTGVGAALQTVAVAAETPELSLLPWSTPPDLQTMANAVAGALGLGTAPSLPASAAAASRLVDEGRREYSVSRHGAREAIPALRRAIREARRLVYIEGPDFCWTSSGPASAPGSGGGPEAHEIDLADELKARLTAFAGLRVVVATPKAPDYASPFGGHIRQALNARKRTVKALESVAPDRVAVVHPIGYPGRERVLRSTVVIVDDVWAMVGATHFRRRGVTFDGSVAVACTDRTWREGVSGPIAAFRQTRMESILGSDRLPADDALSERSRLAGARSAFDVFYDLAKQDGVGRVRPFWDGPDDTDTAVTPVSRAIGDPDGARSTQLLSLFSALIPETAP